MNPVKVLKPEVRLICLKDLSNKRHRSSSSSSSSHPPHPPPPPVEEKRSSGSAAEAGRSEDGRHEPEMKPGCLPVLSKSPVPAITPVGSRPLALTVVTSTGAADGGQLIRRPAKGAEYDPNHDPAAVSRGSSGKASSTPSPNPLHQMAAAAAAAGDDTTSSEHDSPSSPSKQLSKLKRFLKTIHHLGSDISTDIGELVRNLVLALVNNKIGIEEFHDKLHKATNFPLRPFVIPFLKSSLPILQQELQDQAELCRLSPHQFLARNEHLIFHTDDRNPPSTSPSTSVGGGNCPSANLNLHETAGSKRRHSDRRLGSNGLDGHRDDSSPAPKRPRTRSSPLLADHPSDTGYARMEPFPFGFGLTGSRPVLLQDASAARLLADQLERDRIQRDRERYFANYNCHTRATFYQDQFDRQDEEWKHVEHLLQCIVGMVEKCQRALLVLQERSLRSRDDVSSRIRRTVDGMTGQLNIKRYVSELLSQNGFQPTDDQRLDAYRNADESVKDFRRQAVLELQKAVAASEAKAREMLAVDRMKMEQTLDEVRRKTRDEVTALLSKQEDSDENCWNCGRLASQTCSGCNVARYCGAFCQHRHWESHHRVCGRPSLLAPPSSSASSSSSSSTVAPYSTPRPARRFSPGEGKGGRSPAREQEGGGQRPGAGASTTFNGDEGASIGRSRSRTKSVSPVLMQTTIKQETMN